MSLSVWILRVVGILICSLGVLGVAISLLGGSATLPFMATLNPAYDPVRLAIGGGLATIGFGLAIVGAEHLRHSERAGRATLITYGASFSLMVIGVMIALMR